MTKQPTTGMSIPNYGWAGPFTPEEWQTAFDKGRDALLAEVLERGETFTATKANKLDTGQLAAIVADWDHKEPTKANFKFTSTATDGTVTITQFETWIELQEFKFQRGILTVDEIMEARAEQIYRGDACPRCGAMWINHELTHRDGCDLHAWMGDFDEDADDDDEEDFGGMNEQECGELLTALLQGEALEDITEMDVSVCTLHDAGVLTNNDGLIITVGDVEFQVTIVRSR